MRAVSTGSRLRCRASTAGCSTASATRSPAPPASWRHAPTSPPTPTVAERSSSSLTVLSRTSMATIRPEPMSVVSADLQPHARRGRRLRHFREALAVRPGRPDPCADRDGRRARAAGRPRCDRRDPFRGCARNRADRDMGAGRARRARFARRRRIPRARGRLRAVSATSSTRFPGCACRPARGSTPSPDRRARASGPRPATWLTSARPRPEILADRNPHHRRRSRRPRAGGQAPAGPRRIPPRRGARPVRGTHQIGASRARDLRSRPVLASGPVRRAWRRSRGAS